MSGKMNVLGNNVIRTRWVGLALLALVAGLALLATPTPVMAAFPAPGSVVPDVWDPDDEQWENGRPTNYTEGETAAMAVLITGVPGETYAVDLCLEVFSSPFKDAYAFTAFEVWDTTYKPLTLPGGDLVSTGPWDKTHSPIYGYNSVVSAVTPSPPALDAGLCAPNYLGVNVEFKISAPGNAYLVYGGLLAAGYPPPSRPCHCQSVRRTLLCLRARALRL